MAVYTSVDSAAVTAFLEGYDLGVYQSHQGITQGVENTNYHLFTDKTRAILTIFEKRIRAEDLPFVFGMVAHLQKAGLPVPETYADKTGGTIGTLADKPAVIIRFLEGSGVPDATITPDHCAQLGKALAHMHLAAESYKGTRHNPVDAAQWKKLLDAAIPQTDVLDGDMRRAVDIAFADYASLDMAALPRGAVHADLFPDNVFFKDGTLTGLIDFYFACTDAYVYDLAMTVNAWCFTTDGVLVPARYDAFARAYQAVRPLQDIERAAFKTLRRAAALRILSTRLYDWVFTPAGADVVKKDPLEYARKLRVDCTWP